MEENRLKPMPIGYDERLFNQLYQDTLPLRRNLAHQIDARRFGLSYEDILSFFDVKFIFTFSKHHDDPPEKLKAFLLNSLRNFRNRILRAAYTTKYSQSIVSIENLTYQDLEFEDKPDHNPEIDRVLDFMKAHLSDNAYLLLEIQLNPPPFIINKINTHPEKKLQKIPDQVYLEYLDLGNSYNAVKYLQSLKKEIKQVTNFAKAKLN